MDNNTSVGAHAAEYWDVESALAGQAMVQVRFDVPCSHIAHIILPGSEVGTMVEANTDAELPLWLAIPAHAQQRVTVRYEGGSHNRERGYSTCC